MLAKFRKDKDYSDDSGFKTNTYEKKKRDNPKSNIKLSKYFEQLDSPVDTYRSRRK